jgi:Zn-dependent peptidase ImmA (M78 family)
MLDDANVRHPSQIHPAEIAARNGAMVVYGPLRTARGAIARNRDGAVITVDERARGKPQESFTIAHELLHNALHRLRDHLVQCVAGDAPRTDEEWDVEREANDGASELLIPEALGAPFCALDVATPAAIDRLARAFRVSFPMAAIRMTELTMAPCAVALVEGDRVRWAVESLTFPGAIARRQRVHESAIAARLSRRPAADREGDVPGAAWRSPVPLRERAWRTGRERALVWIRAHEDAA